MNSSQVDGVQAPAPEGTIHNHGTPLYDAAFVHALQDVDWGPAPLHSTGLEGTDVVQHQLYFGLRRRDGSVVPDAEWEGFEQTNLPAAFPGGFTVIDGSGGWPDPVEGLIREPSKLVIANIGANQRLVGTTLAALALLWKTQANQTSVLWVRHSALAVNL